MRNGNVKTEFCCMSIFCIACIGIVRRVGGAWGLDEWEGLVCLMKDRDQSSGCCKSSGGLGIASFCFIRDMAWGCLARLTLLSRLTQVGWTLRFEEVVWFSAPASLSPQHNEPPNP